MLKCLKAITKKRVNLTLFLEILKSNIKKY